MALGFLRSLMYRVLLPVGIDRTRARGQVEAVLDLPRATEEVHVDVLHVFDRIDIPTEEAGEGYIDELSRDIENARKLPQAVDTVVDGLAEAGIEAEVHSVTGDPAPAILEIADELAVDALVLGVRQRSPVGKVLFGSVVQGVILDSDRPVIVAPAEE